MEKRKIAGWAGSLMLLYGFAQTTREILGWIDELQRWNEMIGPITQEGLTQLTILLGLILIAPVLGEFVEKHATGWWTNRKARGITNQRAKAILANLSQRDLYALVRLLNNEHVQQANQLPFTEVIYRRFGYDDLYRVKPYFEKLILMEEKRREDVWREEASEKAIEALRSTSKEQRTVLFAFVRPQIMEPFSLFREAKYLSAIGELSASYVISIEPEGWRYGHAPPKAITLSEYAAPIVGDYLGGREVKRRSIQIAKSSPSSSKAGS